MTSVTAQLSKTVLALQQEFDNSFAQAPRGDVARRESLLAIRMGGEPYAIRLAEIGGLHVDRRIVTMPTPVPQLLGVAGFRGQMAPVYDLASLCGYARAESTRWLVLLRAREPVALAFETFEMHLSVSPEQFVSTPGGATIKHVRDAVRCDDTVRPIVHLQAVLQDIQAQADSFIQQRKGQP